jgi:hypothetical protein
MSSFFCCNVISWNIPETTIFLTMPIFMYVSYVYIRSSIHLMHCILTQGIMWSREGLSTVAGAYNYGLPACNTETCKTMALQLFVLTILKKNCNLYKLLLCYSITDSASYNFLLKKKESLNCCSYQHLLQFLHVTECRRGAMLVCSFITLTNNNHRYSNWQTMEFMTSHMEIAVESGSLWHLKNFCLRKVKNLHKLYFPLTVFAELYCEYLCTYMICIKNFIFINSVL